MFQLQISSVYTSRTTRLDAQVVFLKQPIALYSGLFKLLLLLLLSTVFQAGMVRTRSVQEPSQTELHSPPASCQVAPTSFFFFSFKHIFWNKEAPLLPYWKRILFMTVS